MAKAKQTPEPLHVRYLLVHLRAAIELHSELNPHFTNSERQPEQNQQWIWESRQATMRQILHDVEAFGEGAYGVDKAEEEE